MFINIKKNYKNLTIKQRESKNIYHCTFILKWIVVLYNDKLT